MDRHEDIPEFKVIVKADMDISVQLTNLRSLGDIRDEEVNLDPLKRQTIEVLIEMLRDNRLKQQEEFQVLGSLLYSTLFHGRDGKLNGIGKGLQAAIDSTKRAKLLRVQLVFESDSRSGYSWLAKWPWEYLYSPQSPLGEDGYFLSKLIRLVLVRYLPIESPIPSSQVDNLPVKVLFVAASPRADGLPQVQYESVCNELETLQEESGGKLMVYKLLGTFRDADDDLDEQPATFANFLDLVESIVPHVIHFIGHGRVSGKNGQIAFMHEDGSPHWVNEQDFAREVWARENGLRMVFLQACETARLSNPYGAISGVAQQLASKNIPAVVAMQYEVHNQIANTFARAFYDALAEARYIDEAVQAGRQKIATVELTTGKESPAFALPVLYMRQPGGLLAPAASPAARSAPPGGGVLSTLQSSVMTCAYCQTSTSDSEADMCGQCGAELRCPSCKKVVTKKQNFCQYCPGELKGSRRSITVGVDQKIAQAGEPSLLKKA